MQSVNHRAYLRATHQRGGMATRHGQTVATQHAMIIGALTSLERMLHGTLEASEVQECTNFIRDRLAIANQAVQALELEQ